MSAFSLLRKRCRVFFNVIFYCLCQPGFVVDLRSSQCLQCFTYLREKDSNRSFSPFFFFVVGSVNTKVLFLISWSAASVKHLMLLSADFHLSPPSRKDLWSLVVVKAGKENILLLIRRLQYPEDNLVMHLKLNHLSFSQIKLQFAL